MAADLYARRLGWVVAGGFAAWAAGRLAGADRLGAVGAPAATLLPFTPLAGAAAWLTASLLPPGRARTATASAAIVLTTVVAPRAIPRQQPSASGPVLRVLTANLLIGRAEAEPVVDLVRRAQPDVFFVQELTGDCARRLRQAGLDDLLPHVVTAVAAGEPCGNAIYARHRLTVTGSYTELAPVRPVAVLDQPGAPVRLGCVHLRPPKRPWQASGVSRWRDDLAQTAALPWPAWPGDLPVILAGDFNSTMDHAGFRDLLRRGYVDAASQSGNGLVPTWGPLPGGRGALLALDHVLADARCAVLRTSVHRLPGTDHRAVFAELRLPAWSGAARGEDGVPGIQPDHVHLSEAGGGEPGQVLGD
ncbi:MAG TPA: endonuclease/exonuclease/phosphatase family protein [Streptosporangiaceae bacterium]|jgi:endonuclease/exonuclease/phosphatase family metal-dependent hydrolase|nr:endonuclease/exonuclease/phosphatase family protein [Streptosporangiaceae bacterium]